MTLAGVGRVTLAGASAIRVRIPFRQPFASAVGTWHERDAWIVRLVAADGRVGVGEASLDPASDPPSLAALALAIRVALASPDRATPDDTSDQVRLAVQAAFAGARADLECAAAATASTSVQVNATIASERLDDVLAAVEAALRAGFTCLKLKVGGEPTTAHLLERLAAVRALVADDVEIRLDANGAWDRATAAERLHAIAPLDIAYVEQPIPPDDIEGLARLRRGSPVAIAVDESIASPAAARAILDTSAADMLVVKPARVGGPEAALVIATMAAERGVGVTISNLLETGVGLIAAIRVAAALSGPDRTRAHGLATADVLVADLLAAPLEVRDGRIHAPDEPIRLDEATLERWTVDRIEADR